MVTLFLMWWRTDQKRSEHSLFTKWTNTWIWSQTISNKTNGTVSITVFFVVVFVFVVSHFVCRHNWIEIDNAMVRMMKKMSATDVKWLTRILLKKLKLGIGDKRLLDLYNPRAYDMYVQCSNLSDVCKAIDSNTAPDNQPTNGLIQIFRPLRSMLCERGYISQINQVFFGKFQYLIFFVAIVS